MSTPCLWSWRNNVFPQESTSRTEDLTRRIRGSAMFRTGKCGLPAEALCSAAGRPWVGPTCLAPSLPGAPYLQRGGAGRGRRGGAAVPGTSRSSPRDPPRPMAAPQDPLPPGEAGAAGSRESGRGCPEGSPGVRDRRCAGCGPRLPSWAGQSRGRGSWEPGEECSPGRAGKSF